MTGQSHILFLTVSVLAVYANSFWGVFQFDDYNVIVYNKTVHSLQAWLADLPHGIRPLLKLSYMLNWTSGAGLFGFHLVNISIHTANVIMFYFLFLRITAAVMRGEDRQLHMAAFIASLFFAIHPVHTEAVTYISGRSASLMAMFYLASILTYLKGVGYVSKSGRILLLYIYSPLLFILAVLTKETAVTLPFALLLIDRMRQNEKTLFSAVKKQAVHWLLLICLLFALIAHPNHGRLLEFSFDIRSMTDNVLTQIHGISYLLSRIFMPHRLNIDPGLPVVTSWTPLLAAEAALLSCLLLVGILSFKRRQWLGFGIAWFFIHLIPTNSIVPRLDVANERQLYLAAPGLYLSLAYGGKRLLALLQRKSRVYLKVATAVVTISSIALGSLTIARNHVYRNEIAMWEDTKEKSPFNARVHNNLGYAYFLAGRLIDAEASYIAALRLKPDYTLARNNLVHIKGKMDYSK